MKHTPRALVVTAALAFTTITAASAQAQDRSPTAAAAPAAQPSRLHLDVEIDPTAYILRGYSLHVGIGWRRLRVDLGAYAMAMPEFMHGNPDFDVSFHGFGVKAQLFPLAEQRGLFVGIDTGLARPLVQRRDTDLARSGLQVSVGAHVGWRFPIIAGLYVTPWIGVSYSFNAQDVTLANRTYANNPITVFPAVHIGYRFM
ncbi:MAG: hypothetical protein Q8S73_25185 [Deltaproteobacteria bacterium]|nr:hypothetical protein [Myxococcales bacterium]MDP3217430.1 hypothetical protein [Deltaproteobacteria bacterium]